MQPAKFVLGVICAASVLWMGDAYANGKAALRGIVPDAQTADFRAFVPPSENGQSPAAIELEVDAEIESIGPAVVNISASWQCPDCAASPVPLNNPMVLYSVLPGRPCALVKNTAQTLPNSLGDEGEEFLYTAKVTITSKNGNHVIVGDISGGSVCQLEETGFGQSINQWLVSFQIIPDESSGKFAHAIGQGLIDLKYDTTIVSLPGDPLISEGFVQPFQIFLNLDTN